MIGTETWAGRDDVQSSAHNAANYLSWRDAEAFCNKLSKQTVRGRVARGGPFKEINNWRRSAHRHMYKPLDRKTGLGFRIVVLVAKR